MVLVNSERYRSILPILAGACIVRQFFFQFIGSTPLLKVNFVTIEGALSQSNSIKIN